MIQEEKSMFTEIEDIKKLDIRSMMFDDLARKKSVRDNKIIRMKIRRPGKLSLRIFLTQHLKNETIL